MSEGSAPMTPRPLTGAEYLESLRGPREIWIYGEQVQDLTTHPAFRNAARMLARLYDALHDPAHHAVLTCATDTGSGGYTHKYFRAPTSADDLVGARDAIAAWARMTYGWMGRSPDYKAAFLATLGANADFYAPYQDNARRWYRDAQERVLFRESRPGPSTGGSSAPAGRRRRCLRACGERDRRRADRQRRQGGRHRLGAHALQLYRPHRQRGSSPSRTKRSRRCSLPPWTRRASSSSAVRPTPWQPRWWAAPSTTPCPAAWTRTTPSWCSTTP